MRLRSADWYIVTDVWKDCNVFICGVKQGKKSVLVQQAVIRLLAAEGGCTAILQNVSNYLVTNMVLHRRRF